MKKKDSILKRHPIIPSVFFLVFAWFLLYLITGFKEPSRASTSQTTPVLEYQGKDPKWQLKINQEGIFFRPKEEAEFVKYPYQAPVTSTKSASEKIQIYRSQHGESQIQIILLKKASTGIYDVIVEQDGQFFHTNSP